MDELSNARNPLRAPARFPKAELPFEPGSIIEYRDGAYLPKVARLDPQPGSRLGWWSEDEHGDARWLQPIELQALVDRIAGGEWVELVRKPF